mgnify:CR=1 FL=1
MSLSGPSPCSFLRPRTINPLVAPVSLGTLRLRRPENVNAADGIAGIS